MTLTVQSYQIPTVDIPDRQCDSLNSTAVQPTIDIWKRAFYVIFSLASCMVAMASADALCSFAWEKQNIYEH